MKRIGIITLFAALFCFIASAAMAYTIFGVPVNPGDSLQFSFYDAEMGPYPTNVNVGDTFSGIFCVDSITVTPSGATSGQGYTPLSNGSYTLVGNFTYTVVAVYTATSPTGATYTAYDLKDEMNIYYNSQGTGIRSSAVYKSPYLGTTDISAYTPNGPGNLVATFNGTITAVPGPISIQIGTIDNPEPINLVVNNTNALWGPWGLVSSITPVDPTVNPSGWIYDSNDPITTTYKQPIPEPATIMLLGAGLLGLGSWGRKKTKKSKES